MNSPSPPPCPSAHPNEALRDRRVVWIATALLVLSAILPVAGCGGESSAVPPAPIIPPSYTISVSVSGLAGAGLILQNKGTDNLVIAANTARPDCGLLGMERVNVLKLNLALDALTTEQP